MSEQDNKKSGGSGGSVVMVEKSASSRHKPYRPTELQEEAPPDLHKRSKAPAVPSLAEELKNITLSETTAPRERMECEHTVSSEKHMHVAKNISSSGKRRGSSPEEIAMVSLDAKKDNTSTLPQPIPANVEAVVSEASVVEAPGKTGHEKRADDDSITEEITELRTADAAVKDHSEWPTNSSIMKKKEISWKENQYLDKIHLQDMKAKSQAAILERKASVGPCFKPSMLYGGPSGITICVPKKSVRTMKEDFNPIQSVININVSKRSVSKSASMIDHNTKKLPKTQDKPLRIVPEKHHHNIFCTLRTKLDNMTCKIRNLLNM